jgi:hypothetical protein
MKRVMYMIEDDALMNDDAHGHAIYPRASGL